MRQPPSWPGIHRRCCHRYIFQVSREIRNDAHIASSRRTFIQADDGQDNEEALGIFSGDRRIIEATSVVQAECGEESLVESLKVRVTVHVRDVGHRTDVVGSYIGVSSCECVIEDSAECLER